MFLKGDLVKAKAYRHIGKIGQVVKVEKSACGGTEVTVNVFNIEDGVGYFADELELVA